MLVVLLKGEKCQAVKPSVQIRITINLDCSSRTSLLKWMIPPLPPPVTLACILILTHVNPMVLIILIFIFLKCWHLMARKDSWSLSRWSLLLLEFHYILINFSNSVSQTSYMCWRTFSHSSKSSSIGHKFKVKGTKHGMKSTANCRHFVNQCFC